PDREPELPNPGAALDRKWQRGKARAETNRLVQRPAGVPGVLESGRKVDGIDGTGSAQRAEGLVGASPLPGQRLAGNPEPGRWTPHDTGSEGYRQVDLGHAGAVPVHRGRSVDPEGCVDGQPGADRPRDTGRKTGGGVGDLGPLRDRRIGAVRERPPQLDPIGAGDDMDAGTETPSRHVVGAGKPEVAESAGGG